ncbi:SDR family oxidoreductase [Hoyosella rhizosphaerae]|uniref:Short-chain dehydrogenase n=1 Tax=Hoyosella rhizosphaerae TaxID=1755582 RepID=A0A916U424_9ACTN|nr:SDR family oxidoreductase [Hoyosella rhizosphaerae]MBN4926766.1 SDR family oxidoreductase [Hoyosella rhizosphaerae]GGC56647.1 short-chain dehydrogenase [Hoyosella rhizosphaerae]
MPKTRPSVLVTGAAAGIGRATALRFLKAGYLVGAYDVDEQGIESLMRAAPSGRIVGGRLDVTDADAWHDVLDEFMGHTSGRLDVLVNNAGLLRAGRFVDIPLDTQAQIVRVNVDGVINGCYMAYPFLKVTPKAQVINVCSASAIYGQAELATYSATKFAVRGLTEALDVEWKDDDIRVCAVWPLFVNTGMIADEKTSSMSTLGVRLSPEDVANKIFSVAKPQRLPFPQPTHIPVGAQAHALFTTAQFTPLRVLRAVNRRIAQH